MSTDGSHLQPTTVSAEEGDSQTDFTDESPAVPTPVGPDPDAPDANTAESKTDPQPEVWEDAQTDGE
jgi:hypothetical protein